MDGLPSYLNALARVDLELGKLNEAERYFRAADASISSGESGQPNLAQRINSELGLGWIEIERGHASRAVQRFDRVLVDPMSSNLPPALQADLIGVRAVARWKSQDYRGAEADFRRAIANFERLNKPELRERLADNHSGYAALLTEEYRLDEAKEQYREALAELGEGAPTDNPNASTLAGTIWSNESLLLKNEGNFDEALRWSRAAITVLTRAYDYDDLRVARALNNEALAYCRLSRMVEALPVVEQALQVLDKTGNKGIPADADSLSVRGFVKEMLGDTGAAKEDFTRALTIREELFGEASMPIVKSLTNLATLYLSEGKLDHADKMLRQAVEILGSVSQPDLRFAKLTFEKFSMELSRAGKDADARNYAERASKIPGETMDCAR